MKTLALGVVCVVLAVFCILMSPLSPIYSEVHSRIQMERGDRYNLHFKGHVINVGVNDRGSLTLSTVVGGTDRLDVIGLWQVSGSATVQVIRTAGGVATYYMDGDGDGVFEKKIVRDAGGMEKFSLIDSEWLRTDKRERGDSATALEPRLDDEQNGLR